jgi:phenylacetate-CoA ligase
MVVNRENPYWSALETMSRKELETLQFQRLMGLLKHLHENSLFYRKRLAFSGISYEDIKSLHDLTKIPFTTKQDIANSAEKPGCTFGEFFCGDPKDVLRWHKTSGTTGKPIKIADTVLDWNRYADLSAEALYAMGIRREDIVMVAFGYGPFIAFWTHIAGLERIGSTFIPSGNLDTQGRIELMKDFGATVFIGVPSYALHLGEAARATGTELSKHLKIRLVVHAGEPAPPLTKKKIEELWGAKQMERVGCTETGGFAFQCPKSSGIYHIQEGFFIPELINPVNDQMLEFGEEGELILTPLYRRGMPFLRFRTGDLVKSSKERRCKCGRNYLSLEETGHGIVIRRLDKLLKIRGVLVDPMAIENMVRQFEWFGGEFRILLEKKDAMDEITVQIELKDKLEPKELENQRLKLMDELRRKLMVRVGLELLRFGKLDRFEEKAKRIINLREEDGAKEDKGNFQKNN